MVYPFFKIPLLKRVLSYIMPITVAHSSSKQNPFMEFILYRNQWQLATEDALYSDGDRYKPFRIAFKHVPRERLAELNSCLILGAGLGSIVQILSGKYNVQATYSLVEHDNKILQWAMEHLNAQGIHRLVPYCEDALYFVQREKQQFDLICIDIFNGREVPPDFTEKAFLQHTRKILKPDGIWIMNYIINDPKELSDYTKQVKRIFPDVKIIEKDQNVILINVGKKS